MKINTILALMLGFLAGFGFASQYFVSPVDYKAAVKVAYAQGQYDVILDAVENEG